MAATTSLALMAAGAASSAMGSYYSASNSKRNLQLQADLADINAEMSEKSAQQELLRGQRAMENASLKKGQVKGAQRAAIAANGVDLGSDTAVNILSTTDVMSEADRNTIESNAVRAAWGYRTQGVNFQNEALVKRASAEGINPGASAFSTLLTEGGKVASSWYSLKKLGAFDKVSPKSWGSNLDSFYFSGTGRAVD